MDQRDESMGILNAKKLRKTIPRRRILDALIDADHALSTPAMEEKLRELDRVTIYRTLKTFEEKGIVHKVMDDNGVMNYALCHERCTVHTHDDNHVHFECTKCRKTYCLDERIEMNSISFPIGFVAEELAFKVKGLCNQCNSTS
jgi:Fur family ferric uptake transcriptional regulator